MKRFYYAVMNIYSNDKQYSHVLAVPESINLASVIKKGNYDIVHPCETKKHAAEVANFWNKCAFDNGNYLYENHVYPATVMNA